MLARLPCTPAHAAKRCSWCCCGLAYPHVAGRRKLQLKADVEALGAPPSPGTATAEPPSPLVRRKQGESEQNAAPVVSSDNSEPASTVPKKPSCLMKRCMPPDRWARCVRRMKHVTFSAGEVIIEAGHLGTSMYFMDAGSSRYIGGQNPKP